MTLVEADADTIDKYERTDALMRGNPEAYCRSLVKVRDEQGKLVPFQWRKAQHFMHGKIEEQLERTGMVRAIILKGRKLGASTYVASRYYRKTTLCPGLGQTTHIQTHEDKATQTLFNMVRTIHNNMPPDYRPAASRSSAKEMVFSGLGSQYTLSTAKNIGGTGRSTTPQNLHNSEVAFWPHATEHYAGLVNAVPDVPGTEIIAESTACGLEGEFYEQWLKAEAHESAYIPIFLPWWWHHLYRKPLDDVPGYEPSLTEEEYGRVNGLDDEQICWMHFRNTGLGGQSGILGQAFKQEFPSNPQEAFQSTGDESFISGEVVNRARKNVIEPDPYDAHVLGVDMAQKGKDKTWLIDRQGPVAGHLINETFDNSDDDVALAEYIARLILLHKLDRVFIDAAPGRTLCHILHRQGFGQVVVGVDFGSAPVNKVVYLHKRSEMWGDMKDWLARPDVSIPDHDELHRHICAPGWRYRESRILLEDKELIRKRLKCSPDGGDALALTFAATVVRELPHTPSWRDTLVADVGGGGFMTQ